ncbi:MULTISPECIES: Lsr2 family protein [unclassified Pseudonocardia]|uniref:histone-like nucleoid-structuring protein Lsr2 n=1 Tax=unclassified Pseudonocardia TaxID=2619320 RepID=UPI0009E891F1
MTQIHTVRLVDDLSGVEATETVAFGLDGKQFEIDLSGDNANTLREALGPFVAVARRSGGRQARQRRRGTAASSSVEARGRSQAIRVWARENGYAVSQRGRIPADVVSAYEASASNSKTATAAPAKSRRAASNGAAPRTAETAKTNSVQFSG